MRNINAKTENNLLYISVWNGRPMWDDIFADIKHVNGDDHTDIGVCFCGNPAIGGDLKAMCEKYSAEKKDTEKRVLFSLHKENF